MSTSDDEKKTKSQLLAELEEVRRQLEERSAAADADEAPLQPVFAAPMTRRTALSTWVAPVILSIPFGAMARPRTAQGQPVAPTLMPTIGVPALPTEAPTPTRAPTLPPTSFPTAFPTAAPAPASPPVPAPVLSAAGLGAAAAALAGAGAWRLRKKRAEGLDGDDGKPEESDEDSGNEGGTK